MLQEVQWLEIIRLQGIDDVQNQPDLIKGLGSQPHYCKLQPNANFVLLNEEISNTFSLSAEEGKFLNYNLNEISKKMRLCNTLPKNNKAH